MESPIVKRPKMSDQTKDEPPQTSSDIQKMKKPKITYSTYDTHYNDPYYVDKTLLIKELMVDNHFLVTAPSRFGKSLNMDMVKRFFEIEVDAKGEPIKLDVDEKTGCLTQNQPQSNNFKMFQGKKISHEKEIMNKHFGKYPTIHVDFGAVKGNNFEQILDQLREAINKAFRKHTYLLESDLWNRKDFDEEDFMNYVMPKKSKLLSVDDIMYGLVYLAEILHARFGRKVFVFIDEIDVPLNAIVYGSEMKPEDRKPMIDLLQMIILKLLKMSDDFVERSLSNACHQLAGMLSDSANNVKVSRFLQDDSFGELYGFEETEVRSVLEKAGLIEYFEDVKKKYDGYMAKSTRGKDIEIYSPWAILQYINSKKLNNYWAARIPKVIKKQIGHHKIRPKLLRLMSRETVRIKYIPKLEFDNIQRLCEVVQKSEIDGDDADLFLQFLYEMGLFRLNDYTDNNLWLEIPNDSVHSEIDLYIRHYDSVKAYYNHCPKLIGNFIESVKNVGKSCNENSVRDVAKSIEVLFTNGKRGPTNEFEVRRVVDAYLLQYFGEDASERYTADGNRCDTLVWDETSKWQRCDRLLLRVPIIESLANWGPWRDSLVTEDSRANEEKAEKSHYLN
ncbi:hypothetical protein PV328_000117 [Microctonus aethiopoides]|uniref:AAA-ATPase-like domain-containing protein n=1 Tax=Microctonus aethiopoides TaxID=144406 RepID=A0AA39KVX5_9HYME|nr:hypothetical protein PV328_000117 [Microctonus aethiopoides]